MKRIFGIVFFLSWVSVGHALANSDQGIISQNLNFRLDSLVRKVCIGESCANVRMVWPKAVGDFRAERINENTQDKLISFLQLEEESNLNLASSVDAFFQSFKEFSAEFPEGEVNWEIEVIGSLTYTSDHVISLFFTHYYYLGGAHPNSTVLFLNFDPKNGEVIENERLLMDEKKVFDVAELKFRQFHEVEKGMELAEDDRFFLPETGFFLANAIGFKEGKFWIIYIPYEIASYAMGYTELEFSKEELGKAVRW